MPLPFLIAGIGATALLGVAAGANASDNFKRAEEIVNAAKKKYDKSAKSLERSRARTNKSLHRLGAKKVEVFSTQIKFLVDYLKTINDKEVSSIISNFSTSIGDIDLEEMQSMVNVALELDQASDDAIKTGVMAGVAAYGIVGMTGVASTGTAISGLAGVASTNATLAWLGGGSLAAGGFGMMGGMAVLGGIVLAPAMAITGFMMAEKSEKQLTEAIEFSARVDVEIEHMKETRIGLKAIRQNCSELSALITELVERFEAVKVDNPNVSEQDLELMMTVGLKLKEALQIPVITKDDAALDRQDLKYKVGRILQSDGYLSYNG